MASTARVSRKTLLFFASFMYTTIGMRLKHRSVVDSDNVVNVDNGAVGNTSKRDYCKVVERSRVLKYGVQFSFPFPKGKGCSPVQCNIYKFFSQLLPIYVKAKPRKSACQCSIGSHTSFLMRGSQCATKECWDRFSVVLSISKRKEHKRFIVPDFMDSMNHWDATCDAEDVGTVVPRTSRLVKRLLAAGNKKEAEAIRKIVDIDDDEDDGVDMSGASNVSTASRAGVTPHRGSNTAAARMPSDDFEYEEPAVRKGCPPRVIWNIKDDRRCHEVPSMRYTKTACCNALRGLKW